MKFDNIGTYNESNNFVSPEIGTDILHCLKNIKPGKKY
jgi:hypothetical protein